MNANRRLIAGLDEAGRGPLAGPVVAAAVILNPRKKIKGLSDSKTLTEKVREALYEPIFSRAIAVGIGVVGPEQIDKMNILRASLLAMKMAYEQLKVEAHEAWVDGNQKVPFETPITQKTIIDGDSLHECIMAASIVAKVHRDRLMVDYAAQYPLYGFEQHKGYATPGHLEALERLGPCGIHRMTFKPLQPFALPMCLPGL